MCTACLTENVKIHVLSARPALARAMGRVGIEGLAHLDQLPASGATIFIGAPQRRGGTARVPAMH